MKPKLNPTLEKYLDILSEEYKEFLVNKTIEDKHEINIENIIETDSKIKNNYNLFQRKIYKSERDNNKNKRNLKTILLIFIISIYFFIISYIYKSLIYSGPNSIVEILNVFGVITLFLTIFLSIMYIINTKLKVNDSSDSIYETKKEYKYLDSSVDSTQDVLTTWMQVENVLKTKESSTIINPLKTINKLFDKGIINSKDKFNLTELLKARNKIVHENLDVVYLEEINISLSKISEILLKILSSD